MNCNEFKILEEISILQNYEIIAPLYLTIPNEKNAKIISIRKEDLLLYWNYIEKGFYRESGTYIKYFILTNTYSFVDSKDDWKKKIERIRNPSYYEKTKPSLPNSKDPDLWKKYRMNLPEYLEHSIYFEPISSELFLIDILISKNPENDDEAIIDEYAKTMKNSKNTPNTKLSM
ncbi:5355_t:CDS:2 [Gigaspora rosea]|nr:5355_t:CDS:2 [Gigaspora rosea]